MTRSPRIPDIHLPPRDEDGARYYRELALEEEY